ncbi:MAG: gamma-glutamyl-gamma-aminobutyrate hydrolase family protein [Acidobacteriaceae bacterium]|nr:gamma-glutamyl-gamma-aminobutyrate hydrolase family protein [Acidobacteriaceae bacterium]
MPSRVLIPFRHRSKLRPYVDAIAAAGLEPIPAHVGAQVKLGNAEGLLLMGGTDVNPGRYGANAQPETDQPDDARDQAELDLIDEAISKDIPLFAICRGLQILNVYHGGTLLQHLPSTARHDPSIEDKGASAHEVSIERDSILGQIAGVPKWRVNSRHHQAADKVGEQLRVVARDAEDGVIEALERGDKRFVVAVQWHPEDQIAGDPEQLKLFSRFAEALQVSPGPYRI